MGNKLNLNQTLKALVTTSLLAACTIGPQSVNTAQSPSVAPQYNATTINKYTGQGGLTPRQQRMVREARALMNQEDFRQRFAQGQQSFALNGGDFSIQSTRITDNKMYAVGGRIFDTSTGMDNIYEYDPVSHTLTDVGDTDLDDGTEVASAAIAKHPTTGQAYYLESYQNTRRLFRFNPTDGSRVLIGPTGFTDDTVQLTFNREEELYALSSPNNTTHNLYRIDINTGAATQIPLTSADGQGFGVGSGDIAFSADSGYIYRVDGSGVLFQVDLDNSTTTRLGQISGIHAGDTVAGTGFNPSGQLVVLSVDTTAGSESTRFYTVDMATRTATEVAFFDSSSSPSDTYPVADLSSSQMYTCPVVTQGRPTAPVTLFDDDFSTAAANFGNLPGENNPDTTSGWRQWNGDYYPTGSGVTLWNPGVYDPSPGGIDDPNNDIYGVRNFPGEYGPGGAKENPDDERPNLLETSIAKRQSLRYDVTQGDKVKAKLNFGHSFNHEDSDVTFMLCFDDPAETMAVSSTIRGPEAQGQELIIETEIPSCATEVTVIAMGYLGQDETSSLTFENASLEFIPGDFYTETTLLNESFDSETTHPTYGPYFPANFDDQFGPYDLVTVDNHPAQAGDKAVTANNPTNPGTQEYGGLVKQINLGSYGPNDTLSAKMYTATTFNDPGSESSFLMEYYDSSDNKLSTVNAQKATATQFRWLEIDRSDIPSGASYVKLVPIMRFGPAETSSFLWNNLSLTLLGDTTPVLTSIRLDQPANGAEFTQGESVTLRATPDAIPPGTVVEFQLDGTSFATGSQNGNSFEHTQTASQVGSFNLSAVAKDAQGNVLATSATNQITVVAAPSPSASLDSPTAGSTHPRQSTVTLEATVTNMPAGGSVSFNADNGSVGATSNPSGNTYQATWRTPNVKKKEGSITVDLSVTVRDSGGNIVASDGPVQVTVER